MIPKPQVDPDLIGQDDPHNVAWWIGFGIFLLIAGGGVLLLVGLFIEKVMR